ncbi:MAG: tetratricopeptide repeat protein [Anaerolineae bacterium]|nr:tetratricopeptide repeat protein [Anaerolineae bacterium]
MTQSASPAEQPPAEQAYQAGVQAARAGDRARARVAFTQAVRADPAAVKSWMALYQVCGDPAERLFCLFTAGRLAPDDARLRQEYERFKAQHGGHGSITPRPLPELADLPQPRKPITPVLGLLTIANNRLAEGDEEGALRFLLRVLEDDPAQPDALAGVVRLLTRHRRLPEAIHWTERSIQAGNRDPGAYISLAEMLLLQGGGGVGQAWDWLARLRKLPDVRPAQLVRAASLYRQHGDLKTSLEVLHEAERVDPTDQGALVALAEAYDSLYHPERARAYYKRAMEANPRSEVGQAAEAKLLDIRPHTPAHVLTSNLYALREVVGVVLFFYLLAVLDAGLNLISLGIMGWLGVVLSAVGGYLLVTATSSPAQHILDPILREVGEAPPTSEHEHSADGYLPEMADDKPPLQLPLAWRGVIGAFGGALLIVAAVLVLQHSLAGTRETLAALYGRRMPEFLLDVFNQLIRFSGL